MSDSPAVIQDHAALAHAIRKSLSDIYALSDDELVARDGRMQALFRGVAKEATFTRAGAMAFEALTRLTLGAPLPLTSVEAV